MSEWRPNDWDNPWNDPSVTVEFDRGFMAMRTKDGTTPERVMAEDRRDIYEAGADAILEAIWKMAKESPTGTFVFDTHYFGDHAVLYLDEK